MSLTPEPTNPTPRQSTADLFIASRMRFEDPDRFREFYEKQLSKRLIGLRHPEPINEGTPILVIISPPGVPDRLRLRGQAIQVTLRPDASSRLRVQVEVTAEDQAWLDAYFLGLGAALAWRDQQSPTREMPPLSPPPESRVQSLAQDLDTLSYYQLLGVNPDAPPNELQARYHALTRLYHPDLFSANDTPLAKAALAVYRRMNEAYGVLRSPPRRRAYDRGLQGPAHTWKLRLTEADLDNARRQEKQRRGSTKTGDYYWRVAKECLERARDGTTLELKPALKDATKLLRTALAFEPENEHFKHALEHVRSRLSSDT